MEALHEEEPNVGIIVSQFKHRYTKRNRRKSDSIFTATRMHEYVKETLGQAYGKVCKR